MSHTRAQLKTLSVCRAILRYARTSVNVWPPVAPTGTVAPLEHTTASATESADADNDGQGEERGRAGVRYWQSSILALYRQNARVANKAQIKALRATAADTAACFTAVTAAQTLSDRFKGKDPDAPLQRRAVARFVGLTIPERVPVGRSHEEVRDKYSESMAVRMLDPSTLSGIDNLKAQLYGVEAVLASKRDSGSATGSEEADK